jgi:hypothetical protein
MQAGVLWMATYNGVIKHIHTHKHFHSICLHEMRHRLSTTYA